MKKRFINHFVPHDGNNFKPHFVRERNIIGVALLAVAIFGLAFSLKTTITRNPDLLSAVITGVLVDLTNVNRLSKNLVPLEINPILASAAQLKADDMASKSYFAHTSPDGKTPWHWFKEKNYDFVYAGENLAVNFVDSEDVVRAWMNSSGHSANILNDHFTEIGIALASGTYNGQTTIYVVQLFGRPAPPGQVAPPAPIVTQTEPTLESTTTSVLSENVEVLAESEMFIAVQNNDYIPVENLEPSTQNLVSEISFIDRVLTSPKVVLEIIYIVLGVLVLFGLVTFITFKRKKEHKKHVAYVVLLLILVVALLYLSSVALFPQIIIE